MGKMRSEGSNPMHLFCVLLNLERQQSDVSVIEIAARSHNGGASLHKVVLLSCVRLGVRRPCAAHVFGSQGGKPGSDMNRKALHSCHKRHESVQVSGCPRSVSIQACRMDRGRVEKANPQTCPGQVLVYGSRSRLGCLDWCEAQRCCQEDSQYGHGLSIACVLPLEQCAKPECSSSDTYSSRRRCAPDAQVSEAN